MSRQLTLCLHRGTSLIGKLIRWQTRGYYSHASVILPDGWLIEAREFIGVRALWGEMLRLAVARNETVDTFRVEITPAQEIEIGNFLRAQVGKPYDYGMVARFISRRQASRTESGKWFCSELVFAALKQAGVTLLRDTQPWEVSPSLLARSPHLVPVEQSLTTLLPAP